MSTPTREQVGYASIEESCRLIDVVGNVVKEYTDCAIVYTITNDQVRKLIALSRAELEDTIESLRQQLAECRATNGKLLEAFTKIGELSKAGSMWMLDLPKIANEALALPNDATALNELIAERMKTQKEYYESVFQDGANRIAELTAEVERLKSWEKSAWQRGHSVGINGLNSALNDISKAKDSYLDENQRLTELLLTTEDQLAELTAQRDLAISTIELAYKVAVEHDDRIPFDWAMYCEMLHAAITNCKEKK